MEIVLTTAQWASMMPLVKQGHRAQKALGVPVEIDNGDQKIEIEASGVTITLAD